MIDVMTIRTDSDPYYEAKVLGTKLSASSSLMDAKLIRRRNISLGSIEFKWYMVAILIQLVFFIT